MRNQTPILWCTLRRGGRGGRNASGVDAEREGEEGASADRAGRLARSMDVLFFLFPENRRQGLPPIQRGGRSVCRPSGACRIQTPRLQGLTPLANDGRPSGTNVRSPPPPATAAPPGRREPSSFILHPSSLRPHPSALIPLPSFLCLALPPSPKRKSQCLRIALEFATPLS